MSSQLVRLAVCLLLSAALLPAAALADEPGATQRFGGEFTTQETLSFSDLVSRPDEFAGKTVKVSATVSRVCRKKGCWMTLGDPDGKRPETIRITMKDYGFFVPKDCDGRPAIVQGVFSQKVLSEKMAKHYAEDEGKDPSGEKARRELSLVAVAVELKPAPAKR